MLAMVLALQLLSCSSLEQMGDLYFCSAVSTDAEDAHKSANDFARLVGDTLKVLYESGKPSRVLEPRMELQTWIQDDQRLFGLRWSCRLVAAPYAGADFYFDQRGGLQFGQSLSDAKLAVGEELEKRPKAVDEMRKQFKQTYGSDRMPANFVRDSFTGSATEGYWYIIEFFITAGKSSK